jgi:hypothetical protein
MYSYFAMLPVFLLGLLAQQPLQVTPPAFIIHTVSGTPVKGALSSLNDKWTVILAGTPNVRVDGSDFISLRRADAMLPTPPAEPHVIFVNGDRLTGTVGDLNGEKLGFTARLGKDHEMTLPLSALSVLWIADPANVERHDLLRRRLAVEKRSHDLVWLRNGDLLQGNLLKLEADTILMEIERKDVKVERQSVAVIALNTELARALKPQGMHGCLVLTNGARLTLTTVRADARTLSGQTVFGAKIETPLDQVAALDQREGRAVYLSDLKPAAYQYTPFLPGLVFPLMNDANVLGDELRLGGGCYLKGLGMHSPSRVSYALGGAYRRFEAVVGLDDRTGQQGSARVRVLLDGKPADLGPDQELTARTGPRTIQVNVMGVKELTLIVESGRFPFVQGQVNWGDARLVK